MLIAYIYFAFFVKTIKSTYHLHFHRQLLKDCSILTLIECKMYIKVDLFIQAHEAQLSKFVTEMYISSVRTASYSLYCTCGGKWPLVSHEYSEFSHAQLLPCCHTDLSHLMPRSHCPEYSKFALYALTVLSFYLRLHQSRHHKRGSLDKSQKADAHTNEKLLESGRPARFRATI